VRPFYEVWIASQKYGNNKLIVFADFTFEATCEAQPAMVEKSAKLLIDNAVFRKDHLRNRS
jgi:hypothetical protein